MSKTFNMTGGGGGGIKLASIAIITPPDKTQYRPGQTFNPAGMTVRATYSNGATAVATGWTYSPSGALTEGTESVTILYTEGGVTAQAQQAVTVQKANIMVPTQSGSLTYNGGPQSPTWNNYDTAEMTIGGVTSGTNAGSYNAQFSLKDTVGTQWADGTTGDKTVAWSIQKAAGSLSLSPTSMTLDADNPSKTITVTRSGTGAISAQSSAPDVASVSVSGNKITVTGHENGDVTVTVNVAADSNYNAPAAKTCSVTVSFAQIYGVQWDGTASTTWSRTDAAETFMNPTPAVNNGNGSSPFDTIMPWAGMVVEDDATAGKLVKIPKYWFKWTRSGNGMKLQISNGPEAGFHVSPAHADRGDGKGERDYVYVGRYHCNTSYKSQAGSQPAASMTRAAARSSIHNLGSTYWQYDFAMYWTIMMLYLVEYANWNSQATIGYGCSPSGNKFNMGLTDNMQYHTGTTAAARTTYGSIQYRHIEGLWDNVYDWCDGIRFSGSTVYCIANPASFSDTSGGTNVGTRATSSGWISGWTNPTADGFEYALYPNAVSGSETTYVCDYCYYGSSGVVLFVGGGYGQNQDRGAFCLYGNSAASNQNANIGCRPLAGWHTSLLRFKPFPRFDIDGWNGRAALAGDMPEGHGLVHAGRRDGNTVRQQGEEKTPMKRAGNLFPQLISDGNLDLAIDEVNRTHRWHPHHKPNRVVKWVEETREERRAELRQMILDGFTPSPSTPKRRWVFYLFLLLQDLLLVILSILAKPYLKVLLFLLL